MKNRYQVGSDDDWLQHSNEELARLLKKRDRSIRWLRGLSFLLFLALAWATFKFLQKGSWAELWTR